MNLLASLVLLAASTSVELVDEVYQIPPSRWNYVPINLRQNPARIDASFRLSAGAGKVRLALMTQADLERLREELPNGVLAITEPGKSGALKFRVRQPGDYALVVDNRDPSHAAAVHLRIGLDFAPPTSPEITRLSPPRQLTVIVLSFLFFFGVVTYSARKLMAARRS